MQSTFIGEGGGGIPAKKKKEAGEKNRRWSKYAIRKIPLFIVRSYTELKIVIFELVLH